MISNLLAFSDEQKVINSMNLELIVFNPVPYKEIIKENNYKNLMLDVLSYHIRSNSIFNKYDKENTLRMCKDIIDYPPEDYLPLTKQLLKNYKLDYVDPMFSYSLMAEISYFFNIMKFIEENKQYILMLDIEQDLI